MRPLPRRGPGVTGEAVEVARARARPRRLVPGPSARRPRRGLREAR